MSALDDVKKESLYKPSNQEPFDHHKLSHFSKNQDLGCDLSIEQA
jgi:hypothetical protein